MQMPFSVGLTYIMSTNIEQITEIIEIITKDAIGNEAHKTLVPTIDPYQQQTNIVAVKYNYKIDMFTDVICNEIFPKTTFLIYLFPNPTSDKYLIKIKLESKKTKFQKFLEWLKK